MYNKHTFVPVEYFYQYFEDITEERVVKLGFHIKNNSFQPEDFNRVGYAQYVMEGMSERELVHVKYKGKDNEVKIINFNKSFNKISQLKQFKCLEKYNKIKVVLEVSDKNTDKKVDFKHPCEVYSSNYRGRIVGFLVK